MKNWYHNTKIAAWEDYSDEFDKVAPNNPRPFASWFGEDRRAYIPFNTQDPNAIDPEIAQFLQQENCQVIDYRGGRCQRNNREYRIGKLIQQALKREMKVLQDYAQQAQQMGNYQQLEQIRQRSIEIEQRYNQLMEIFSSSSIRNMKGEELYIVFSDLPKDVAMMSTERGWTSCMDLDPDKNGSQAGNLFCEVARGGFVAYLIGANDKEIQNPYARIHIRRLDSQDGRSIAVPEEEIYGNEVPGFKEAVQQWIEQRQGKIEPGYYNLQGSTYSDSVLSKKLYGPDDPQEVLKWLRSTEKLVDGGNEMMDEVNIDAQRYMAANKIALAPKGTYPDEVIKEVVIMATDPWKWSKMSWDGLKKLFHEYNEFFDQSRVEKLPYSMQYEYIKGKPEQEKQQITEKIKGRTMWFFENAHERPYESSLQGTMQKLQRIEQEHGIDSEEYEKELETAIRKERDALMIKATDPMRMLYDDISEDMLQHLIHFPETLKRKFAANGIPQEALQQHDDLFAIINNNILSTLVQKKVRDRKHFKFLRDSLDYFQDPYIEKMNGRAYIPPWQQSVSLYSVKESLKVLGPMAIELIPFLEHNKKTLEEAVANGIEKGEDDYSGIREQINDYKQAIKMIRGGKATNWYEKLNG